MQDAAGPLDRCEDRVLNPAGSVHGSANHLIGARHLVSGTLDNFRDGGVELLRLSFYDRRGLDQVAGYLSNFRRAVVQELASGLKNGGRASLHIHRYRLHLIRGLLHADKKRDKNSHLNDNCDGCNGDEDDQNGRNHSGSRRLPSQLLSFAFGAGLRDSFTVCLFAGLNRRRELFLLPAINLASLIDPLPNLLTGLAAAVHDVIASSDCTLSDGIARLSSGFRSVEHTYQRTQSEPSQEPTYVIAIVISHHNLRNTD